MKNAKFYLLLFYLFPLILHAQFEKGTIELVSGEKLEGYIKRESNFDMHEQVQFQASRDDEVEILPE